MRLAPEEAAPKTQHAVRSAQREEAAAQLLAIVEGDPEVHGELSAGIAASMAWLPARERTKTNNIRLIHEMRVRMRVIGERMVALEAFDEIEDFGFLEETEYSALFAEPLSLSLIHI